MRAPREALLKAVVDRFGWIDLLVNNAGVAPAERRDLLEATEESFDRLIRINLRGPFFLTQAVANFWLAGLASSWRARAAQDYYYLIDFGIYGEHQSRRLLHEQGRPLHDDAALCRAPGGGGNWRLRDSPGDYRHGHDGASEGEIRSPDC